MSLYLTLALLGFVASGTALYLFFARLDDRKKLRTPILFAYALAWSAPVLIYAYKASGSYQFFNCWHIVLLYVPPIGLVFLVVLVWALVWIFRHRRNINIRFMVALHLLLLQFGLVAGGVAASLGAEDFVSCL